jgi:hypothetical protein
MQLWIWWQGVQHGNRCLCLHRSTTNHQQQHFLPTCRSTSATSLVRYCSKQEASLRAGGPTRVTLLWVIPPAAPAPAPPPAAAGNSPSAALLLRSTWCAAMASPALAAAVGSSSRTTLEPGSWTCSMCCSRPGGWLLGWMAADRESCTPCSSWAMPCMQAGSKYLGCDRNHMYAHRGH